MKDLKNLVICFQGYTSKILSVILTKVLQELKFGMSLQSLTIKNLSF